MQCGKGETLRIVSAFFGRKSRTVCTKGYNTYQLRRRNCEARSAKTVISKKCDGQRSCAMKVENRMIANRDPCYGTAKYAQVEYVCESENREY